MELIDPRLISENKAKNQKENEYEFTPSSLIYTAKSLSDAMPGISYERVQKLISEKKIRTIPAGVFNARWEVIPVNTLMEDLKNLIEKYN